MEGLADGWRRYSIGNRARLKGPCGFDPRPFRQLSYSSSVGTDKLRVCRKCGAKKPQEEFSFAGNGYRRSNCKKCDSFLRQQRPRNLPTDIQRQSRNTRNANRLKKERDDPRHNAKFIYEDSRKSDRKHLRKNDLTKEFIKGEIEKGCSYCGETELRMTLDRIDNERGHTKDNVVPACIRCNYTRKDMPYEAWLVVATGMRAAQNQGLFGDWTGRARTSGGTSRLATAPALSPGEPQALGVRIPLPPQSERDQQRKDKPIAGDGTRFEIGRG